ncbi:MAG: glycosyltransferase family A protein [Roseiflexaceae bacterium]
MAIPELSIIIASVNGRPYLDACLAALRGQTGNVSAEVIVVDCVGSSVTSFAAANYPEIRVIAFDEPRSVPELRSAGILAARGDIIVITEDHCIPTPDWYESIRRAHATFPEPAIGGSVDNAATRHVIDWAVYFCEYSNFISPVVAGIVHDLPGPNVSYKRSALRAMDDLIRDGYWETFLHLRLESQGQQLRSEPSVRVLHKKHFSFTSFLLERFHYARAFAGTRNEFVKPSRRLFYFMCSPLLPPLLITRIVRRVWARKRHLGAFVLSLPYIALFMVAWAAGEWVDYAIGPGESALQLT